VDSRLVPQISLVIAVFVLLFFLFSDSTCNSNSVLNPFGELGGSLSAKSFGVRYASVN